MARRVRRKRKSSKTIRGNKRKGRAKAKRRNQRRRAARR